MVIAIDGPAASGKSSTAKAVAAALGFRHADSGALYRAVTAARARDGGKPATWTEADVLVSAANVTFVADKDGFEARIGGDTVNEELRSPAATAVVSQVAKMPGVRAWVNRHMHQVADSHDIVVDGRDMGTVVFPDAELKIYLVADPRQRAIRRLRQRDRRAPDESSVAIEIAEITARDARDAAQSVPAKDAVVIDTTDISQSEQIGRIVTLARAIRRG